MGCHLTLGCSGGRHNRWTRSKKKEAGAKRVEAQGLAGSERLRRGMGCHQRVQHCAGK